MGIEPFLVATGVECVVAQRLARRLCDCKSLTTITPEMLQENGFDPAEGPFAGFEPVGCVRCSGTGFKGRMGIYELMGVDDEIRELILAKGSEEDLRKAAIANGMTSLRDDGLDKVKQGLTSVAEVLRVIGTAS
jgi:type IV pilus assembly protein PilB